MCKDTHSSTVYEAMELLSPRLLRPSYQELPHVLQICLAAANLAANFAPPGSYPLQQGYQGDRVTENKPQRIPQQQLYYGFSDPKAIAVGEKH